MEHRVEDGLAPEPAAVVVAAAAAGHTRLLACHTAVHTSPVARIVVRRPVHGLRDNPAACSTVSIARSSAPIAGASAAASFAAAAAAAAVVVEVLPQEDVHREEPATSQVPLT